MANKIISISKQKGDFAITNAKVIGILAALALYLGNDFIADIINDPHKRIDILVDQLGETEQKLRKLQIEIINITNDDINCENKNIEQDIDIDNLKTWKSDYVRWRGKIEAEMEDCQRHMINDNKIMPRYY